MQKSKIGEIYLNESKLNTRNNLSPVKSISHTSVIPIINISNASSTPVRNVSHSSGKYTNEKIQIHPHSKLTNK